MKRFLLGAVVLVVVAGVAVAVYTYSALRSTDITRITDDLHMLAGNGSNVAILDTDEGTVIVDTMTFPLQGEVIRERAEAITGKPVVMIINTHYHLDHTHGNPAFAAGTRVVATVRTREHLDKRDADFWDGDAAALLPQELVTDRQTLRIGGKTLQLLHPGRGHTDGDLVVYFVEDKTVHTGDLVFNNMYPNIDLEGGGSVQQWSASLESVLALPFEHVIPGHGDVTDRDGVRRFQRFMDQLAAVGREAAATGASLQETQINAFMDADQGFGTIDFIVPLGLDRDFVIRRAWEEATGTVTADY